MIIVLENTDGVIYDKEKKILEIVRQLQTDGKVEISLNNEGPCATFLRLYDMLDYICHAHRFNPKDITIRTANQLESHPRYQVKKMSPMHLIHQAREMYSSHQRKDITKHFGLFVHRSNGPRLHLATYVDSLYSDSCCLTYHFNHSDNWHREHIGIEFLINQFDQIDITKEARFLAGLRPSPDFAIDISKDHNQAQQLCQHDRDRFLVKYKDFFLEIVCEGYFNGSTFFPTEKIWRPILQKTPFVVQGPTGFLRNLKKLGFQTFDRWWSEGYDDMPVGLNQLQCIKMILDRVGSFSIDRMQSLMDQMHDVLEHNYELMQSLTPNHFRMFYES